jgi:hypothetical protein
MIDDDVPDHAWEEARDFFEDVLERVKAVGATIERTGRVTELQRKALDNWESAVARWIDRESQRR